MRTSYGILASIVGIFCNLLLFGAKLFIGLDEYKNDLDIRKIAYLKGLWGGGGQTKKNTNTDGMAAQTIVTTGVALCGQDKPTQDMALYTRVIFLAFSKTSFMYY